MIHHNDESNSDDVIVPLEQCVTRSLHRLGYPGVQAVHQGKGEIRIDLRTIDPNDRNLVLAAVRTVPGVTDVSS